MKPYLLALLLIPSLASVRAQGPTTPEQKPDLSDKALITKKSPTMEKERTVQQYTIEQFMKTTRVGGSSFAPNEESVLFHSNQSGIFNVYRVPVSGGAPKQLTDSAKESTYLVSAFPADARFLYRHDVGGNENEHIYLRELDGSERDLTPGAIQNSSTSSR